MSCLFPYDQSYPSTQLIHTDDPCLMAGHLFSMFINKKARHHQVFIRKVPTTHRERFSQSLSSKKIKKTECCVPRVGVPID